MLTTYEIERRVKELEMYALGLYLFRIKHDAHFQKDMFKLLNHFEEFDIDLIVAYIDRFGFDPRYKPYHLEFIGVVYTLSKVIPVRALYKICKLNGTKAKKLLLKYGKNQSISKPVVPEDEYIHIKNFVNSYVELKEALEKWTK